MGDSLAVSIGGMPLWCNQLMASCPFLFSFEARCKYFKLEAFGQPQVQPHMSHNGSGTVNDRRLGPGGLP
ncbi:E3 ubiquitin-protein ligase UPL4 [Spatholobus suberectus]|nr:E3 ubiquitin-protein ligase UPL4 [Spatholobus suberectus]